MAKRGPRTRPADVVQLHPAPGSERPPVPWDRIVLTEAQAAEFLKVARSTVRKHAAAGRIPRYRVGSEYRYYVYDLIDYMTGEA